MGLTKQQVDSIIKLTGPERYAYSLAFVATTKEFWGLWDDGWALATINDEEHYLLLWPAKEYAELCRYEEWEQYQTKKISLNQLLDDLLPSIKEDKIKPGIFMTQSDGFIAVSIEEFSKDLVEYIRTFRA